MDEARRFLRYVIPGVLFGVEAGLLLWLLRPEWAQQALGSLKGDSGLGLVAGGVLASGSLGYVFSSIHHWWYWRRGHRLIDHSPTIRLLVDADLLELRDASSKNDLGAAQVTRENAWSIMTALWHQNLNDIGSIGSAEPKASVLTDLFHSNGTARVAALLALLAIPLALATIDSSPMSGFEEIARFIIASIIGGGALFLFHQSCRRVGLFTQAFIDEVLVDSLARYKDLNNGRTVKTYLCSHSVSGAVVGSHSKDDPTGSAQLGSAADDASRRGRSTIDAKRAT